MRVIDMLSATVGNVEVVKTIGQSTTTTMVRVDVGGEREVASTSASTSSSTSKSVAPIPSPAWPSLTLYDEAWAIRTKFLDLITTRTIYSLTVNHLTHFDQAWRSRSISRLREVYWEVLRRWCGEEGARYEYAHRPATVVRYDRRMKRAVVEEVNPDLQS